MRALANPEKLLYMMPRMVTIQRKPAWSLCSIGENEMVPASESCEFMVLGPGVVEKACCSSRLKFEGSRLYMNAGQAGVTSQPCEMTSSYRPHANSGSIILCPHGQQDTPTPRASQRVATKQAMDGLTATLTTAVRSAGLVMISSLTYCVHWGRRDRVRSTIQPPLSTTLLCGGS